MRGLKKQSKTQEKRQPARLRRVVLFPSIAILLALIGLGEFIDVAFSQTDTLPQGIILYQFGYRGYSTQNLGYNDKGEVVATGDRFNKNFDGTTMLSGRLGPELKKLGEALKDYDGTNGQSLLNTINLGRLRGDVKAEIEAKFFGLAYGITDKFTFFLGVPQVTVKVDTQLRFDGTNNATQIRDLLGNAAFEELRTGLDRAAQVGPSQVINNIQAQGFAPFEHWENQGLGDIVMGLKTGKYLRLGSGYGLSLNATSSLSLPTGYKDNPDILTDSDFGKPYYGWTNSLDTKFNLHRYIYFGGDFGFTYNFAGNAVKRVPVASEDVADADRKTNVSIAPGKDTDIGGYVGLRSAFLGASYRIGRHSHSRDIYSGSLAGNYEPLGEKTETKQISQQAKISFETIDAFRKKKFPVPFILAFTGNQTMSGSNVADQKYYEMSISSFLPTPFARPQEESKKTTKDGHKRDRKSRD